MKRRNSIKNQQKLERINITPKEKEQLQNIMKKHSGKKIDGDEFNELLTTPQGYELVEHLRLMEKELSHRQEMKQRRRSLSEMNIQQHEEKQGQEQADAIDGDDDDVDEAALRREFGESLKLNLAKKTQLLLSLRKKIPAAEEAALSLPSSASAVKKNKKNKKENNSEKKKDDKKEIKEDKKAPPSNLPVKKKMKHNFQKIKGENRAAMTLVAHGEAHSLKREFGDDF